MIAGQGLEEWSMMTREKQNDLSADWILKLSRARGRRSRFDPGKSRYTTKVQKFHVHIIGRFEAWWTAGLYFTALLFADYSHRAAESQSLL